MSYTLIITEKPNAAQKIAQALAAKAPTKRENHGAYWYELERDGKRLVIVPAVGHLFTLKPTKKGWDYPIFDTEWVPTFQVNKKSDFAKKYYENIKDLAKDATDFIVATDYDTEGEVIGTNILRFLCGKEDSKRMKFSTLTKDDLIESYENPEPHINFGLANSGLARHQLDWLWGINTSRALTLALKHAEGKISFYLLSAGRVQAPTLEFLAEQERVIKAFKPTPYWEIHSVFDVKGQELPASHAEDKFWDKPTADISFKNAKGNDGVVVEIQKREYSQNPPVPFDLTSMQTEAYNLFGYSPTQTLSITQSLYERGHVSYPRTSSQKLPAKIGYKSILGALAQHSKSYAKIAKDLLSKDELIPNEGKKDDPAHPAIYPTAETPKEKLTGPQQKIYDLIVRRFLAVFGDPARRESIKLVLDCSGEKFHATGRRTIEKGWIEYYGSYARFDEVILPEVREGDRFSQKSIEMHDKETQPPSRYSQGSIVKEMEAHNLGTKATRANILQTLYERGYIEDKSITVTQLGMVVSDTLKKYVPDIVSVEMTRKFEEETELIESGKKTMDDVIEEAKKILSKMCKEFKLNEASIGKELMGAVVKTMDNKWIVGECPTCKNNLRIIISRKTKKRFIGCEGWQKKVCNFAAPLPQSGMIATGDFVCKICQYPVVTVIRKGKRPWRLCINPKCPQKEEWAAAKEAKEEKDAEAVEANSKVADKVEEQLEEALAEEMTTTEKKPKRVRAKKKQ